MTVGGERQDEAAARKRRTARDSLLLSATVTRLPDGLPQQVRARNLSAGGMMAEGGEDLDVGVMVEVQLRGVGTVTGQVAWALEDRVGIAFAAPIDPLLARKPVRPTSRSAPASLGSAGRRPGLRTR